jgi:hypothetical protein
MDSYLRFRQTVQQLRFPRNMPFPQITETAGGEIALLVPTPSLLVLFIPPGAHTFHFRYGMLDDNYSIAAKADPVQFRLHVQNPTDGIILSLPPLWTRQLNPSELINQPGLRKGSIDVPNSPQPLVLVLQTLPGPSKISSDTCWSDLEFR